MRHGAEVTAQVVVEGLAWVTGLGERMLAMSGTQGGR